jgi:hypothetical protein
MTVPRQSRLAVLVGLLLILIYFGYRTLRPASDISAVSSAIQTFVPLPVENPALRLDLLDKLREVEYHGPQRNIFSATPIAPPPSQVHAPVAPPPPPVPSGPPPLTVPATFFGYVADARTGTKRAFFNSGDDVYVLGVGEILVGRFRLLQIGNNTAELEETSSGRRTTLTLEEPGNS